MHVTIGALTFAAVTTITAATPSCRYIPGDARWPKDHEWTSLNHTVHGHLIRTVPVGHVCHDPTYNDAQCTELKAKWGDPFFKTTLVEGIMSSSFANKSCDPFAPRETPCDIGGYAQYSINVTCPEDVSAGLDFARRNNVRVVVRNTGHE